VKNLYAVAALAAALAGGCSSFEQAEAPVRFGVIADVQYCETPEANGARCYRRSKTLLGEDVAALNAASVDLVLNLGDLIDRGWENYPAVLSELGGLKMPVYNVAGNHDFSVAADKKSQIRALLGQKTPYYAFTRGSWRFLALDTNVISLYSHPAGSPEAKLSRDTITRLYPDELNHGYNGGYGAEQLAWVDRQLSEAAAAGEKVVIFQHCPVASGGKSPAALDSDLMLELIDRYPGTVRLCLSGHHHPGGEFVRNQVLFKTVKAQVESDVPTYLIVELTDSAIIVHGFGSERDCVTALAD